MIYGVLLGADVQQEWLLHWWWRYYSLHNDFPVAVADFGLSDTAKTWVQKQGAKLLPIPSKINALPILLRKPGALLLSPFVGTLWLDLDCQIKNSLYPLFNTLGLGAEIAFVREGEKAHAWLRAKGYLKEHELSFNTGVVAVQKRAPILHRWSAACQSGSFSEDQYALTYALSQTHTPYVEWPFAYNWPSESGPNLSASIIHYHGPHGKRKILTEMQSYRIH